MSLNFDALPKEKPTGVTKITPGNYPASVHKAEMTVSGKTNNTYLKVVFKLDEGPLVFENYFDSDKPFVQYKLGQLLRACNVQLQGTGTLQDVAKVIRNKRVRLDLNVNDKGYPEVDYTGVNDGVHPIDAENYGKKPEEATEELEVEESTVVFSEIDDDF